MILKGTIELKGMEFYAYHGVIAAEKVLGQRFWVDVTLYGDFREAMLSDDLAQALDYTQVYRIIKEIMQGKQVNLLEHLAYRLAETLAALPMVKKVKIKVKKPEVPLAGILDYVGVEIVYGKDEN